MMQYVQIDFLGINPPFSNSMDFYKRRAVEDWTCEKLIEFYHDTLGQKDGKKC
jgi:hypothetical protein